MCFSFSHTLSGQNYVITSEEHGHEGDRGHCFPSDPEIQLVLLTLIFAHNEGFVSHPALVSSSIYSVTAHSSDTITLDGSLRKRLQY